MLFAPPQPLSSHCDGSPSSSSSSVQSPLAQALDEYGAEALEAGLVCGQVHDLLDAPIVVGEAARVGQGREERAIPLSVIDLLRQVRRRGAPVGVRLVDRPFLTVDYGRGQVHRTGGEHRHLGEATHERRTEGRKPQSHEEHEEGQSGQGAALDVGGVQADQR